MFKNYYFFFYFGINLISGNMIKDQVIDLLSYIIKFIVFLFSLYVDAFFQVILDLVSKDCNFHLSVIGQQFSEQPEIFTQAKENLENDSSSRCRILNWGYVSSKEKYFEILSSAHVVGMMLSSAIVVQSNFIYFVLNIVSTAEHEFYGVSM